MQSRLNMLLELPESLQRVFAIRRWLDLGFDDTGLDRYECRNDAVVRFSGVEELEVVVVEFGFAVVGD